MAPAKKSGSPALNLLLAVAGLALFVYLVVSSGVTLDLIFQVGGGGFGLLVLISGVVILLDSVALYFAVAHAGQPGLGGVVQARLGGDAMQNALPGGVLLGEAFKAMTLRRRYGIPLWDGAAGLVTIKLGLGLSQATFIMFGLCLSYALLRARSAEILGFHGAHLVALALTVGMVVLMMPLFYLMIRGRSFQDLAAGLARLPLAPLKRLLQAQSARIATLDRSMAAVLKGNRGNLLRVYVFLLTGWFLCSLESYLLLHNLGAAPTFRSALVMESVGSLFRLIFFLVPSGIGGQDASFMALFRLYRLPAAAGGTFVLVKRVKELLWIGVGFVLILVSRRGTTALAPQEQP